MCIRDSSYFIRYDCPIKEHETGQTLDFKRIIPNKKSKPVYTLVFTALDTTEPVYYFDLDRIKDIEMV